MANYAYWASSLTGGGLGALDAINGSDLADKDMAIVANSSTGEAYLYWLDEDNAGTETSPSLIAPDTSGGNKRWVLIGLISTNTGLKILDTNASHTINLKWNENDTADRILNLLVAGGDRSLTLNENFTIGDGQNVTITAAGQANTLTLNESLTVGDGSSGTLTYSAASKTLTVEDTSIVNQDLTTDATGVQFGKLYINDTANADMTTGITINQSTADDDAIALKSSDVAQPFTTIAEADTYAQFRKAVAASGGLVIRGLSDTDAVSLVMAGRIGSATPTSAPVRLTGVKSDGTTGDASLADNEKLIDIYNNTASKLIIYGNGDIVPSGTITLPNTGLHVLDTNASHDLIIAPGSDLTADRTLTLTTGDAARTITLSGNPTLSDWFGQSVKQADSPTFAGGTFTGNVTIDKTFPALILDMDSVSDESSLTWNIGGVARGRILYDPASLDPLLDDLKIYVGGVSSSSLMLDLFGNGNMRLGQGTGEIELGSFNRTSGTMTFGIGGAPELSIATGIVTVKDGGKLKTDKIEAYDSAGLKLYEDGGKGIDIADSTGNATFGGNLVIPNAGYIGSASDTDAIQIEADGDVLLSQKLGVGVTPSHALHVTGNTWIDSGSIYINSSAPGVYGKVSNVDKSYFGYDPTGYIQLYNFTSTEYFRLLDAGGAQISGNLYVGLDVSALTFTDRTPFFEGDALSELMRIKGKDGEIDHSTLPLFTRRRINKEVLGYSTEADGRDIGATVSMLTVAIQQLKEENDKLVKRINDLEKQ